MNQHPKIIVIGGVAGGASAAARARRIHEKASITLIERGPTISFANCGMPYYLGGIITDRNRLLVQTAEAMKQRFQIDVRTNTEALVINRNSKTVVIKDLTTQQEVELPYDYLFLSPGADPIYPPLPGSDLDNIFTLRSLNDMDAIMTRIEQKQVNHVMVVGGGFIGLELAEAFKERAMNVTLVEMAPQVMNQIDPEMAAPVQQHLIIKGVDLKLGISVNGFKKAPDGLEVQLSSGEVVLSDCVVMAIGVKPEIKLAKEAGLTIGDRGGIVVNNYMQTSDPMIYAVGDAVETQDYSTYFSGIYPLAGPANRQGRLAADHALSSDPVAYRGTLGTAICKIFDMTVASTGLSEKTLLRINKPYEKIYTHPASHAGYYPGAYPMSLKLLYSPDSGRLLGAQITGVDGIDKRIDVLATAIQAKMTVYDLEHLELSYAPPYGSAKDPVNYAGFIASNALRGMVRFCHTESILEADENQLILDVRTKEEVLTGSIPGSINIPLDNLRERIHELPANKELLVYCQVGLRSYLATRILEQNDFSVQVLSGGYNTYKAVTHLFTNDEQSPKTEIHHDANEIPETVNSQDAPAIALEIDARGLQCPGPIIQLGKAMKQIKPGEAVKIMVSDPGFVTDAPAWCLSTGHRCGSIASYKGYYETLITKSTSTAPSVHTSTVSSRKKTLVVFSNDFDRAMATFIIANGAASMGSEVTMFFTFWGLSILRKPKPVKTVKDIFSRLFSSMLPRGADKLTLSKLNMAGMGTAMMQYTMKKKHVASLQELIGQAQAAGVKLIACTMTMDIMGIQAEELIDGVELGGVANYLNKAEQAGVNLFI